MQAVYSENVTTESGLFKDSAKEFGYAKQQPLIERGLVLFKQLNRGFVADDYSFHCSVTNNIKKNSKQWI